MHARGVATEGAHSSIRVVEQLEGDLKASRVLCGVLALLIEDRLDAGVGADAGDGLAHVVPP